MPDKQKKEHWFDEWFKRMTGQDLDIIFAYDTVKEVKVLDRRLGYVYYAVYIMVLFYIIIYVFLIRKQYLETEKTSGWIISRVFNPGYDQDGKPWDVFDSVSNPGETGALFLPTRVLVTRGQVQEGFCESLIHECKSNQDCDIGDEQLQKTQCTNGHCMRRQWCPTEEMGKPTTTEHLVKIRSYNVWFQTSLHYHKFMLDVTTTDEKKQVLYPGDHANTYPLHDLLRMANIDTETVQKLGAIMQVNHLVNCDLDAFECQQNFETANIDTKTGFNFIQNHFYFENGVRKRDTYHYFGIRMILSATGIGKRTSLSNIVLQLSSAIALLTCAQTAADMVLQYVVPERRHYVEMKVLQTENFNKEWSNRD